MNWYLEALKKYVVFSGRARREEYWYFLLFNILFLIALGIIDIAAGTFVSGAGFGLLSGLYGLATLIPSLAVSVRRLHDTNRSGWWLLIGLIPLIGAIVLIVFTVQDSQTSENQYGHNPKLTDDSARVNGTSLITHNASRTTATMNCNSNPKNSNQSTSAYPPVTETANTTATRPTSTISQQTVVGEDRIYSQIAEEIETGNADKGLWTYLFAECNGDEKQTKVLYIKRRAERLLSAEKLRLEQEAKERAVTEWEHRTLCGNGACIGVIDSTGRCTKCGKTYEEGIAADKDRAEKRRQQQVQKNSRSRYIKTMIYGSMIGILLLFLFLLYIQR